MFAPEDLINRGFVAGEIFRVHIARYLVDSGRVYTLSHASLDEIFTATWIVRTIDPLTGWCTLTDEQWRSRIGIPFALLITCIEHDVLIPAAVVGKRCTLERAS